MGKWTAIAADAFNSIQLEAGVLLKTFNPNSATKPEDADILCVTTGGIKASCVPNYIDMGQDVDNCPENTKELKLLKDWTCQMTFTALNMTADLFERAIGAATHTGGSVMPNEKIVPADFKDLWWVGDNVAGGYVAVHLLNALSTGGLNLSTTKNNKGQLDVTMTGHYSLSNIAKAPMEFYVSTTGSTAS